MVITSGAMKTLARSLVALLLVAGCREGTPRVAPVELQTGAVAADQPLSQAIGESILADGGSAVDAAVATALALGVENPASSGIGGGGFAVVWDAEEGRAYALDFRERAPSAADESLYRGTEGRTDSSRSRFGCLAAGVPGEIAGLSALHARFGRLSWERVVVPAQRLAADGWTVSPYLATAIERARPLVTRSPELAAMLLDEKGAPRKEGDELHDPDLANTLGLIAKHGRKAFYQGQIAAAIEAACRDVEGAVRASDLADYAPVWRQPLVGTFRGHEVIGMPPPSSGGAVVLQALNILEPAQLDRRGADAALSYHLLAESMKHGFADRAMSFGDPDFSRVPVAKLVSKDYAENLRNGIDAARTRPSWAYGTPGLAVEDDAGTAHLSVVDARGNAVALTTSVNGLFGSGVRAPRTGILLNNTMDDFSIGADPNLYGLVGSARNALEPRKRPLSSMSPTIVLRKGRVRLVAGGAGGPRIISATLQTVLGVLAEDREVADAVDAPRIHHQWKPDVLLMETGVFGTNAKPITQGTANGLTGRGHVLEGEAFLAVVNAVEVRGATAVPAPDPRKLTPTP